MSKRGKPHAHTSLMMYITKALTDDEFSKMKITVTTGKYGNLLPGELQKIGTVQALLEKLEHKGVFRVGNYMKLKEIMTDIGQDAAIQEIEETERQLKIEGVHVTGGSASGTQNTQPNANNSRSLSVSDALPSDFPVMDFDHMDTDRRDMDDGLIYDKGKGYVLFINNFEKVGKPLRIGSEKDREHIERVFDDGDGEKSLKYQCAYESDLKKSELMKILEKTKAKLARGNYSIFFLIICSHGEQFVVKGDTKEATMEGIIMVDNEHITEDELTKPFLGDQLKAFKDKPKVFIIQACRSPRQDFSDDMDVDEAQHVQQQGDSGPCSITQPVNADVLISYATTKGTRAWRNDGGTWYIEDLCTEVQKLHKKKHLLDIMVRVNNKVAQRVATEGGAKQMPCQLSTLTKDVWLV